MTRDKKNRRIFDQLFKKTELKICLVCDCLLEKQQKLFCSVDCWQKNEYATNTEYREKRKVIIQRSIDKRKARLAAKNNNSSDETK